MSPEYEGPQDEEEEGVAPRRVKHLIVLPGGRRQRVTPPERTGKRTRGRGRRCCGGPRADVELGHLPGGRGLGCRRPDGRRDPARGLARSKPKLKLRVISRSVTSTKAPGMPFIIFASVLVGAAIFALVVLHVMVDQSSFRMDTLESQVTRQQAQLRELRYAVSVQEAPAASPASLRRPVSSLPRTCRRWSVRGKPQPPRPPRAQPRSGEDGGAAMKTMPPQERRARPGGRRSEAGPQPSRRHGCPGGSLARLDVWAPQSGPSPVGPRGLPPPRPPDRAARAHDRLAPRGGRASRVGPGCFLGHFVALASASGTGR